MINMQFTPETLGAIRAALTLGIMDAESAKVRLAFRGAYADIDRQLEEMVVASKTNEGQKP